MSSPAPEVRIDQLTGLRTILAPARAGRPADFSLPERPPASEADCPFCEGREDRTPPETWADRPNGAQNGPGWRVRAVPNMYPALAEPGEDRGSGGAGADPVDPLRASARAGQPDLFAAAPAGRTHEVIVHCPEHRRSLAELDERRLATALAGWRARMREHAADAACVQLIVNEGPEAGASLEHSHAQLYALGFVPAAIARERERFRAYYETAAGELLADVATEEVRRRERLVAIDDEAVLICPWASRSPFELRLIPRRAAPAFERDEGTGDSMLATALRALRERFGEEAQLNLWVRTAPRGAEPFHWHLDLVPRLAIKAGFELSTGIDINTYPPERAASELREALG